MKALTAYLLQFGDLDGQQLAWIEAKSTEITLKKNSYFSDAGSTARRVGFLTDGVMRSCSYNDAGEAVTRCFIDENNFVVDLNSFVNQVPSTEYFQAVTDCRLRVFEHAAWSELAQRIPGWEALTAKIVAAVVARKMDAISPLVSADAATSYRAFMEKYPSVVNRVPLAHLASYLGITQSSLSRIRKNTR